MKPFLFSVLTVFFAVSIYGQGTSDCIRAISICDTLYIQADGAPDSNVVKDEINPGTSCLPLGEIDGRWFRFGAETTGTLQFSIIPSDTAADFDWVLYDLAGRTCADIYTDPAALVSCSFSGFPGNEGITGANGGTHPAEEPVIAAEAGSQFYLYITSYAGDISGYSIDFSGSSFQFQPCSDVGWEDLAAQITVFPNPAQDYIQVAAPFPMDAYRITDLSGSTVLAGNQPGSTIRLSGLNPGMYFLHLDVHGKTYHRAILRIN